MAVDLHMHSNASDGALPPEAMVALAAESGVKLMALTDHDTMIGVSAAREAAEHFGVDFIAGVEVSAQWAGVGVHVVGLGLDEASPAAAEFFRGVGQKRAERGIRMGEAFEKLGIKGAYEGALALAGNKNNLSRTHFALWLCREKLVDTYQQAFDKYLKPGRPCFAIVDWPSVGEAVDFIRGEGGIAVVAHPGRYKFPADWWVEMLLRDFRQAGGLAIEVSSGSQPVDMTARFAGLAGSMGFFASMGSDWHSSRSDRPGPGAQPKLAEDLLPVWTIFGYPPQFGLETEAA